MIKLLINLLFFFTLSSCIMDESKKLNDVIIDKTKSIKQISFKKKEVNSKIEFKENNDFIYYLVGDPYNIDGVNYIPKENYNYNEVGLATFYGKELHNKKTLNNDLNKVTELLGRHKTLPLPSIVKVTNLENGLFLTIKINDRHKDNSSIIQLSRKSAQLLKFYKNKIAKVKVEVIADPSKQMKIVTSQNDFNNTIESAPTEDVTIIDIDNDSDDEKINSNIENPIEIGFENIENKDLFLKIYEFNTYNAAKSIIKELELNYKFTIENEDNFYNLILGPLKNKEANNLVLTFIAKGYKKNEFILQ